MPPGISSQSTACSRQATWVRVRPRSRWRLDHTFSTAAWFSAATFRAGRRAQRRDGHRPGVVGVVLVRRPGRQQPHPGAQLGLHVEHPLARGHQLLGQQVAQAPGALDRPGPLRPGRCPRHQPPGLGRRGAHPQLAQRLLGLVDRHRGVRGLVRVDTDHHCCHQRLLIIVRDRGPWRACLISVLAARASFEPRHGETPQSWHLVRKPDRTGRQAVREPAPRTSRRYDQTATPTWILQSGGYLKSILNKPW